MFASAGDGVCIDVVIERGPISGLLTQSRWRRSTGRLELLSLFFPIFFPSLSSRGLIDWNQEYKKARELLSTPFSPLLLPRLLLFSLYAVTSVSLPLYKSIPPSLRCEKRSQQASVWRPFRLPVKQVWSSPQQLSMA